MKHPGFYKNTGPYSLAEIAEAVDAKPARPADSDLEISDLKPLDSAGPGDLSFFDNPKYRDQFHKTTAGGCIVSSKYADEAGKDTAVLISDDPYRSFARALAKFYPGAMKPRTARMSSGKKNRRIAKSAVLEDGITVEPGAVIGQQAHIGRETIIAAGAVIGARVYIGRGCYIGPKVTITNALIGDRVNIHAGAAIGQDGFGFAMSAQGHLKVPQIGRVIIQDDVEIGACTTIDRGALGDTVIGEGSKLDNAIQIGHNVTIGRHCVIVAQTGVSGSVSIGDFVVIGGQSGMVGHISIGDGAQLAANSKVAKDIPPGAKVGGMPAKPIRQWQREMAIVARLAQKKD